MHRPESVFVVDVLDGVRVPEGTQALTGTAVLDVEQVAAQEVDVPVPPGRGEQTLTSLRSQRLPGRATVNMDSRRVGTIPAGVGNSG